ncbi:uncharacterized protein [Venturia canescens]|nr:uncharacterized protein LOC122415537 isoform X2 [Venturia canescens]XP_043283658.1 uncharacterized protein LOC122415537 isoform X2 [Venturia canescens]
MNKKNKTSTARETVYDRCAYVGCYNGKFINGRKLFHFPAETDRRLEMWIERSGNFRLRTWAATSLRKAGLCGDHFDERSFTNATRKALRRNVVPRHYTEDFKYRQASRENQENDRNNALDPLSGDGIGEMMNFEKTALLSGEFEELQEVTYDENEFGKVMKQSNQDDTTLVGINVESETKSRSSSPLVEFIVEELDETLLPPKSPSSIDSSIDKAVDDADYHDVKRKNEIAEEMSEPAMRFETSDVEENSRFTETPLDVIGSNGVSRRRNPLVKGVSDSEDLGHSTDISLPQKRTCCPYNDLCSNLAHGKTLRALRNENKQLRRKIRLLKQNLGSSEARESNIMEARSVMRNIDEFLDVQGCTNPATRAIVKLSLHKPNTSYTNEEKDFSIQFYKSSPEAFFNLRKIGCNVPGQSTMERWLAEENHEKIVNFVTTNKVDEDPEVVASLDSDKVNYVSNLNGISQDPLTLIHMETEIHYMPESIDDVEVLSSPVVPDHVLHNFEVQPDSDRSDKEFVEPPDICQETLS